MTGAALRGCCEKQAAMKPDRLLNLFCELVRIESPSRLESAMAARCRAELEALGFTVRFDDSAAQTGSDTGNLIARRAGDVPGALVLCGHMDTVQPCAGIEPVVEDGVIRSAGDTILSADDKARRHGHLRGRAQPGGNRGAGARDLRGADHVRRAAPAWLRRA